MTTTIYLPAGATEADIADALKSMVDGGTLVLPHDATIAITRGLVVDVSSRDITIDLNGSTLLQSANTKVLTAVGTHTPMQGVVLGHDANGNATITYDKIPADLVIGDWIKVVSDDAIPGDHIDPSDNGQPTRLGQAAQAIAIDGNVVTLQGPLERQDLYLTNIRATEYQSGTFVLKNGSVSGNPDLLTDLVQIRSAIGAEVNNVAFHNGQGSGVNVVDCANTKITDCTATNLGAGVHSAASLNTSVDGLYAENVAHGVFDNCVGVPPNSNNASQYGADIGLNAVNSVVYGATRAAYDFHSEAINGRYENDLAFDSNMFGDFRGFDNAMVNSGGAGNNYGVQFNEYGVDDARGNLINNMILRETKNYTFIISNQPADNLVENSVFESYGTGYAIPKNMVAFQDTTILQKVTDDNDRLVGTDGANLLLGGRGSDIIFGNGGDDYLWGGQLSDILIGGAGRDRFAYHDLSEGGDIIADFQTGSGGDVIDVSVLAARLGWPHKDPLATGDMRVIQFGADSLVQAHEGNNWVTLATLSGVTASTFGSSNVKVLLSDNAVEPVVLSGGTDNDTLTGTPADETLNGGKGADVMAGGPGNDVYFVDDPSDVVVELVGGGTDTVFASTNYTLQRGSEIEILNANSGIGLILTGNEFDNVINGGNGDDSLRGREGNDTLNAGAGNDALDGGPGIDTMIGGAGNDTYFVDNPHDIVVEVAGGGVDTVFVAASYTLAEDADIEFLRANPNAAQVAIHGNSLANTISGADGNDMLDGGGGNDALAGGAGNDTIIGGAGDDRLDGQAGVDVLIGGDGNDIYHVSDATDSVVEFVGGGFDTVWTSVSYTLQTGSEVEVLRAIGPGPITLTGNEFGNTIEGSSGADVLDGQAGNDALYGGGGFDVLIGGAGDDRLDGGSGADAMSGGTGNDVYIVDNPTDAVIEAAGAGFDTVFATVNYTLQAGSEIENLRAYPGSGGLTLTGNELNNTVIGGAAADTLNGGAGNDTLTGGLGADTFVFDLGFGHDTVTDFVPGQDVIKFDASFFDDFAALLTHTTQVGADAVITVDADQSVTLTGVSVASLHASDFLV